MPRPSPHRVLARPLPGGLLVPGPVRLVDVGDLRDERVVRVRVAQQGADGEEDFGQSQGRRPLLLQDVQADSAELVDVGVVDLRSKEHLWWDHWVLLWQEELAVEEAALVWGLGRTSNLHVKVSIVLLVWLSVDAYDWVLGKSLGLL